jgi:hypothetical protein
MGLWWDTKNKNKNNASPGPLNLKSHWTPRYGCCVASLLSSCSRLHKISQILIWSTRRRSGDSSTADNARTRRNENELIQGTEEERTGNTLLGNGGHGSTQANRGSLRRRSSRLALHRSLRSRLRWLRGHCYLRWGDWIKNKIGRWKKWLFTNCKTASC